MIDVETPGTAVEPMLWSGWGDPAKAADLPDPVRKLLSDALGVAAPAAPAATFGEVVLPAPALSARVLSLLAGLASPRRTC